LTDRIGRLSGVIKALGAVVALLPGVAILLGLVDIPPSVVDLIKFTSFALSVAVVIVVLLLSQQIQKLKPVLAAVIVSVCAIAGGVLAVSYLTFTRSHIVVTQDGAATEYFIIPLNPSGEIKKLIEPYQGDYVEALETSVQRDELVAAMQKESGSAIAAIVSLLLFAQTLVISAIVIGAWKLATIDRRGRRTAP
jgi:hypothetical protein